LGREASDLESAQLWWIVKEYNLLPRLQLEDLEVKKKNVQLDHLSPNQIPAREVKKI
jgi:hypothetical protein